MSSTTLTTFLLRTPSNVRSVELLGSWDNFSRPYPMERDRRMGSGHWRGCHTFTDIVRDGAISSQSPGRTGGLKMGGTYWYFYRLDGNIEYYNEAEPVTSLCPLLPGQPVNILNVPIILPDTDHLHRRDNSINSVKSDQRTMNPEDKYMNPRTPPKPRHVLPRLKTSPPLYQQTTPSSSSHLLHLTNYNEERSPMSQPTSSTHSPKFRLVPKGKVARSVSPPRSRRLRAALLNITGTRSPSGDHDEDDFYHKKGSDFQPPAVMEHANSPMPMPAPMAYSGSSCSNSSMASPVSSPVEIDGTEIGQLPFRHLQQVGQEHSPEPPSIHVRRASKSSRDHTPLPELLMPGPSTSRELSTTVLSSFSRPTRLETLEEALSQQTTPMAVQPQRLSASPSPMSTPVVHPNLREKRLPTLPNSPSSVLDAEMRDIEAQYRPLDMELLRSHFSDDTSGIASTLYCHSPQERSRFSEWSTDTELISPASMTSSSTFNVDHLSNPSPSLSQAPEIVENDNYALEAPLPSISISGPTTPVLGIETNILLSPIDLASDSPLLVSANHSPSAASISSPRELDFSFNYDGGNENTACSSPFHEPDPKRHGALLPMFRVVTPLSVSDGAGCASSHHHHHHHHHHQLSSSQNQAQKMNRFSEDYAAQSVAMKELMDEIGYLGDLISSGL